MERSSHDICSFVLGSEFFGVFMEKPSYFGGGGGRAHTTAMASVLS